MKSGVFVAIAQAQDIPEGSCKAFHVNGTRVALAHLADGWYAVENRCSHANSQLLTGTIYRGRQIACPVHGARFDLKSGEAKSPPAFVALATYAVRVVDGAVEVAIPE